MTAQKPITDQTTYEGQVKEPEFMSSHRNSEDETQRGAGVEIISGKAESVPQLELELLRKRLAAGAFVVLFGFGIYLIRSYFEDRPLQGFHTLVVFSLVSCIALLVSRAELTLQHLRYLELAIFGVPVLFFVPYHYLCIVQQADEGNAVGIVAMFKNVASYWFCLLVIYGLFVPNRWRRALIAVTPMVVLPVAAGAVAAFRNDLIGEHLTPRELTDTFMILCVGALCAAYGAEIIQSLRKEAREAREFGQYKLLELLGKGGMGEVYKAEHRLMKRPCAIKLIRPDRADATSALKRFEREVKATAKLTHWNTIDVYDFGKTDDGVFYYVMEYLPGMSVKQMLRTTGPAPPARVVHIMLQICDALIEAHEQGLIHRDITTGNVFVTHRGGNFDVAKLLDFGLVKNVGGQSETQITQLGSASGTPTFMSPEQASGDDATHASDIYSLGAVCYMMLTGRPPFMGKSSMEVMVSHIRDQAAHIGDIREGIPQQLQDIIHRCLEKSPDARFQSAQELRQAIVACEGLTWPQPKAITWWYQFGDKEMKGLASAK